MREHVYHIHDLVTVRVASEARPWVLKSVNQQIGSFESPERQEYSNPLVIEVKPFAEFSFPAISETFQETEGGSGSWYADRQMRQALCKTENGYVLYTDAMVSLLGLLQQLFLRRSISFAHAAALKSPKGEVILLAGAGGVGKTALAGFLVQEKGYRLLGDDMVLLRDSGECLAFPRPFTLKEYHRSVYSEVFKSRKRMAWQRRLVRAVIWQAYSNAPFRGLLDRLLKRQGVYNRIAFIPFIRKDYVDIVPVEEIFGADHLAAQGRVAQVFFLTRSSASDFTLQEQNSSWAARRMFAILYEELADELKGLLNMGALGLEDMGVDLGKARVVLEQALSGKPCSTLRIPQEAAPDALIAGFDRLVLSP